MAAKEAGVDAYGKQKAHGATFIEPMRSHGRDRDDGFRNPRCPSEEGTPAEAGAEARRTPPRMQSLMDIVGSDELLAHVGLLLFPRRAG